MASISSDPNGWRRIQFVDTDGSRKTIRLGKTSLRVAEGVKYRVERLLECKRLNHPLDGDMTAWVAGLDSKLADRLARAGLVTPRTQTAVVTLGGLLSAYVGRRTDTKPATAIHWGHTCRNLLTFFGADRSLASITAGDAADFERWLQTGEARENRYAEAARNHGLSPNTVRKRISNAKQFFQDAVDRELLIRNPFFKLKGSVGSNRERDYFLSRENTAKILEACPDAQWRLIVVLSRYGGLRCPSEHLALTWHDVDWDRGRIRVRSPKTEHHKGKGEREIPLFSELREHLEAAFDAAEPGTTYVITRYRDTTQNLRTTFQKIIRRAGLRPWPKLFQNLRASRATELANEYPAHVAAAWLGHSTLIANKHYWQVTDEHFQQATQKRRSNRTQIVARSRNRP